MKTATWIAMLAGSLLVALLLEHYGVAGVVLALRDVGWVGFATVIVVHCTLIAAMGVAWLVLIHPASGAHLRLFVWGRLVRDSVSEVLPLSQVGGFVAGGWAIATGGVTGALVSASTIVDVTAETTAQLAYTGLGLALLDRLHPDNGFARFVLIGLAGMTILLLAFVGAQRHGLSLLVRLAPDSATRWVPQFGGLLAAERNLKAIYSHPGRVATCWLIHLATWIGCGVEIWLALRFMGLQLSVSSVLALESLLYGVRAVAFLVPNAVGVQEGAYVALGALVGLSPDVALALSLLKRGRDVVIGGPVLLAWQAIESHRALQRLGVTAPAVIEAQSVRRGDSARIT